MKKRNPHTRKRVTYGSVEDYRKARILKSEFNTQRIFGDIIIFMARYGSKPPPTVSEISEAVGLSRGTTYKYVRLMLDRGLLSHKDWKRGKHRTLILMATRVEL